MDEWIKTAWYIHTMKSYSALKKEENPAICNDTDGPGGHYAKWKKPGTKDKHHIISLV